MSGLTTTRVPGDELDVVRAVFDEDSVVVREYRRRILMQRIRQWRPRLRVRVTFALMPRTQRRLSHLQQDVSRTNILLRDVKAELRELRLALKERQ